MSCSLYEPWASAALGGGPIVGITETLGLPQLALVPLLLAAGLAAPLVPVLGVSSAYLVGWAVLVIVLDAVAFGVLIGRSPSHARRVAAWFWCGAVLLLGPIALYRIDAITVPLAVIGGLWLVARPMIAAALLTAGAWIKIWPGALVVAAVVAVRARWRGAARGDHRHGWCRGAAALFGADTEILGFLTEQTGRGLQIEAGGGDAVPLARCRGGCTHRVQLRDPHLPGDGAGSGCRSRDPHPADDDLRAGGRGDRRGEGDPWCRLSPAVPRRSPSHS